MSARLSLVSVALLLLALLAATPLRAQGVEYAAGTTKYRLVTSMKGTQTSPMGSQDFTADARQQLTVNLAKQTKDTMVATVTLDSFSVKSAQGTPDVSRLLGAQFISYMSPTGRVYSTRTAENADPMLAQVTENVARFLPTYRRDLKPGATWSDTTTGKVTQQGIELDRTVISDYKVVGDTAVAGEKAFKVERASTGKAAGSGSTQGTPISLESTTTSNAVFFLTPGGQYLGGRQNDDIAVKITIIAQGAEITIKQLAESRIEAIK